MKTSILHLLFWSIGAALAQAQGSHADYERAAAISKIAENKVFRTRVEAHWSESGDAFWYENTMPGGKKEIVLIDAIRGVRSIVDPAPWEAAAKKLNPIPQIHPSGVGGSPATIKFTNPSESEIRLFWVDMQGNKKPYGEVKSRQAKSIGTYARHVWAVEDESGQLLGAWEASEGSNEVIVGDKVVDKPEAMHPSEKGLYRAFIRNHNVWLKQVNTGVEEALTTKGNAADAFSGTPLLSPDGSRLACLQTLAAEERKVSLIESSPKDRIEPKLTSHFYLKPGDKIAKPRVRLFNLASKKEIAVSEELFANPWSISHMSWASDGGSFRFLYNERGHQVLRVLSVDAATGAVRTVVEEKSPTFVDYSQKTFLHWLDSTRELLWMSERDGWNHLWMFESDTGRLKKQLTRGNWVVRGVERVDEEKRQVLFRCAGIYKDQDPYYNHFARVNLDDAGLTILTQANGYHSGRSTDKNKVSIRFSPDERWFLDVYSRVDLPPVTELRRTSDGALVCVLEKGDAKDLTAAGWRAPEPFMAKGRDGSTDIHGVIFRPSNFNPAEKYPVIEQIYAGPHGHFVPKEWNTSMRQQSLAELGFIVVQIDGMGTNWRSRAFHEVAWKNLKDGGFPDRIAWMRAAAGKYPQMDLARVGIYGGSAGGQNALAALLHHGDFYKAGASDCGCHDNRMDKIWWNEAWMGWPVGQEYAENSNVTHAGKLTGKLLLTVGELDHNVDPASTMQVVNALIKADKDFELLVIPGADHGAGESTYAARRRMDFFVKHLLGTEPRWK
jgi:dipeptidyl aminopeptidase/acylaminoacyl peptidase